VASLDEFAAEHAASRIAELEVAVDRATKRVQEQADETARYRRLLGLVDNLAAATPTIPKWAKPSKTKRRGDRGTAFTILSDMHYDELVSPDETRGANAYSRDIALARTVQYGNKVVELADRSGIDYDGIVVFLLGDSITGWIHEELVHATHAPPARTVLDFTAPLASLLRMFADRFGHIHLVATVGNHGRTTKRQWAKRVVETNWDWVLAENLRTAIGDDNRFDWDIPLSADAVIQVYDTTILATHGNHGISGGNGISGIWPPLIRGMHKKRQLYAAQGVYFDLMVCGHWHQFTPAVRQGFCINGSLKGTDEWSMQMGFPPADAEQTFGVITPEHGVTQVSPVFCADRKGEGW